MLTVVLLALMRRLPAGARLLLAVTRVPLAMTRVPLAIPRSHFDVSVVPRNSRSVCKRGRMIGGLESLFGLNENVFRAHGKLCCSSSKLFR